MPKTPQKKTHIIKKLTQTPRTKKVLVSEGILPNDEVKEGQLFSSLQKSIEKLKPHGTAKKRDKGSLLPHYKTYKEHPKSK